jgi:hypothetical protein
MLHLRNGASGRNCQGRTRRTALKAGFLGVLGLSLADLIRLRALGAGPASKETSVILLWLDGGPSQLETYDPKPAAPIEYRGPFGAVDTIVPGIRLSERLPRHARHADKMVFVRSLHHGNSDHFAGAHWMLTGREGANAVNQAQRHPSVGSYAARVRGPKEAGLPAYVGLPAAESVALFPGYQGAAYLGAAYNPFDVDREQRYLGAASEVDVRKPKCLENLVSTQPGQVENRLDLLKSFDTIQRDLDASGTMDTLDRYQQEAVSMILGGKARAAFDVTREDPRLADRYGKGPWGRYALMARRLVEAGVTFVTVDMPHWDDHANIKEGHGGKLGPFDQAVGALIEDLDERGQLDQTLVVAMGEFGRTPRLNDGQPGPGRDHWGGAISAMLAGGGLKGGQVVGATGPKADYPADRPLKPADLLATIYQVLGIDPTQTFKDHSGRPVAILDEGKPIAELF